MASRRANIVAGVVGVSAGLWSALPTFTCVGAPCSSCLACVGAGGAAAAALVVSFVSRRIGGRAEGAKELRGDLAGTDKAGGETLD